MKYLLFLWKRRLEDIFIFPFILLGRARADKYPLQEDYDIFFFFPFYHTGGAEKVHAEIAHVFAGKTCLIIFTRRSQDRAFLSRFQQTGHRILDISAYTDNKKQYWKNLIWRGVVTTHINRQKTKPMVFNGQCNFAYKCAPWIKKNIPQLELIHSFNTFSWIRIPFLSFYQQSIMISRKAIADHTRQYADLGISGTLLSRIRLIPNGIRLPSNPQDKDFTGNNLLVLYVGRGTTEKRVHIIAETAKKMQDSNEPFSFSFMGDVRNTLPPRLRESGNFYGNLDDPEKIESIYGAHHVLVITSSEEGFPLVVMEAMAMGCIILATPVGDLTYHIHNGVNGFLFSTSTNEQLVQEELSENLRLLLHDQVLCRRISENNRAYAKAHFSLTTFEESYRALYTKTIKS